MEEKRPNFNIRGPWWKPAFEIFSEISTWIAVPVIFAVILGKYLDTRYGTKPFIFISSVVLAFVISSFGMVRSMRKYASRIQNFQKDIKNINKE